MVGKWISFWNGLFSRGKLLVLGKIMSHEQTSKTGLDIIVFTFVSKLDSYCWWKKSCTSWLVVNLIIYRVLYLPGGAGFLPSTVFEFWVIAMDHTYATQHTSLHLFWVPNRSALLKNLGPQIHWIKKKSPHMSYLKPGPQKCDCRAPERTRKIRFEQIHVSKDMRCNDYVMIK